MLEDTDYDDDDSDSEWEGRLARLCALRTPFKASFDELSASSAPPMPTFSRKTPPPSFETPNRFKPFQEDIDDDTLEALNSWATKVSRKSARNAKATIVPKSKGRLETITVKNEDELDDLLQLHPHLAALPDADDKIPQGVEIDASRVGVWARRNAMPRRQRLHHQCGMDR